MKKILSAFLAAAALSSALPAAALSGCAQITVIPETSAADTEAVPHSVETDISEDLPDEVVSYAVETVSGLGLPYDAVITEIARVDTGTVGLWDGIDMYRLKYSAGGAEKNDLYILVYFCDADGGVEREPVGSITEEEIEFKYGAREILDVYGNRYTAAAAKMLDEYKAAGKGR